MDDSNSPMPGFFDTSGPLVFAHRGGCALGPENTLTAFDRGLAAGADGLELDVQLSKDGVVVVHHDETLDRTTDVRGPVAGLTADELSRVDAAYRFQPEAGHPLRGQQIGVPTLVEVLTRFPATRVIIEMKGSSLALAACGTAAIRYPSVPRVM
jgi:glycerophosphoryl diester phosphodiesterase